jgi:ABC-type anion transport system duplicated permease subunit
VKLFSDVKTGIVTALSTGGIGAVTALNLISDVIGIIGVILGAALTGIMIYNHWKNGRATYQKTMLEMEIMREREARRAARALERKNSGLPTRRADD